MQTKQKSNSVVTHKLTGSTTIEFNVVGASNFVFDFSTVHPQNRHRAEIHGWVQRIVDRAAIGRNDEGVILTAAQKAEKKFRLMKSIADHYMSGSPEWSDASTTGEILASNLVVQALASVIKVSPEVALEKLKGQAAKQGKTIHKLIAEYRIGKGKVRDAYEALRDAAQADTDASDAMLDELAGVEEEELAEVVDAPAKPKFQKSTKK